MTNGNANAVRIRIGRRDYFAAFAMQAITNNANIKHGRGDNKAIAEEIAEMAFYMADAMIKQRKRRKLNAK
jgi:hypothetical protein